MTENAKLLVGYDPQVVDERVRQAAAAAVLAAAEECEAQAKRFEQLAPDGEAVWANAEHSALIARHCANYVRALAPTKPYELLERLKKAEADSKTLQDVSNLYAKLVTDNPAAQNYVEAVMVRASDGAEFVLTIRRREGKTPHERMVERNARWRAAVEGMLTMEPRLRDAIGQLAHADVTELTEEGRAARAWACELDKLLKGE